MELTIINTYLEPNGQLVEGNRPLFVILFESGKSNYSIYDMDNDDKYENGKVEFRGHFYISKDGKIFKGRPINTFGEFAYDETRLRNFNINSIGIVVEGDYTCEIMPQIQKSAIILLIQYLKNEYTSIKSIYGLDELISNSDNPGMMFPLNEIIASSLNLNIESVRVAPDGNIRYAFGTREISYDPTKLLEGNDIKEIQFIFSLLGYICPLDGVYGSETFNAVMNFQRSYNLISTGIVDSDTFTLVKNLSRKFYENKLTFNRILEVNKPNYLYGDDTKRLQNRLNLLGFKCIETGFYDEDTAEAVLNFQKIHSLIPDGKVGPITWQQITSDSYSFVKRILSYTTPLMYGDDIRLVQQRLEDLGYDVGNASGWYDEVTKQQVINFQKSSGLEATGIVDEKTSKALFN